jgi:hypothetical protein
VHLAAVFLLAVSQNSSKLKRGYKNVQQPSTQSKQIEHQRANDKKTCESHLINIHIAATLLSL